MSELKEMTIMSTRYLKILLVALALIFAQGCSFYARLGLRQQTPQGLTTMAQNMTGQGKTQSN